MIIPFFCRMPASGGLCRWVWPQSAAHQLQPTMNRCMCMPPFTMRGWMHLPLAACLQCVRTVAHAPHQKASAMTRALSLSAGRSAVRRRHWCAPGHRPPAAGAAARAAGRRRRCLTCRCHAIRTAMCPAWLLAPCCMTSHACNACNVELGTLATSESFLRNVSDRHAAEWRPAAGPRQPVPGPGASAALRPCGEDRRQRCSSSCSSRR